MRKYIATVLMTGLIACNQSKQVPETKTLDFGAFTIETPKSWHEIDRQGTDSYVGSIAIDKDDTVSFDLGWYSNRLNEDGPYLVDRSWVELQKELHGTVDSSEVIVVKDLRRVDADRYKKQNLSWDTIGGHYAKIVFPIRTGVGVTGIYIDSLRVTKFGVDNFNLYGVNLKPENEKKFLGALRTLKFKND